MRQIRNPRYAPEFLERKLSPSSFSGSVAVAAEVQILETSTTTLTSQTDSIDPETGEPTPPRPPSNLPQKP